MSIPSIADPSVQQTFPVPLGPANPLAYQPAPLQAIPGPLPDALQQLSLQPQPLAPQPLQQELSVPLQQQSFTAPAPLQQMPLSAPPVIVSQAAPQQFAPQQAFTQPASAPAALQQVAPQEPVIIKPATSAPPPSFAKATDETLYYSLADFVKMINEGRVKFISTPPVQSDGSAGNFKYFTITNRVQVTEPNGTVANKELKVRLPKGTISIGRNDPAELVKKNKDKESGIKMIDQALQANNIQQAVALASMDSNFLAYLVKKAPHVRPHIPPDARIAESTWSHYYSFNPQTEEGKLIKYFLDWVYKGVCEGVDTYKAEVNLPDFDIHKPGGTFRALCYTKTTIRKFFNQTTGKEETVVEPIPGEKYSYKSKKYGNGICRPTKTAAGTTEWVGLNNADYEMLFKKWNVEGHPVFHLRDTFIGSVRTIRTYITMNSMGMSKASGINPDEEEANSELTEEAYQSFNDMWTTLVDSHGKSEPTSEETAEPKLELSSLGLSAPQQQQQQQQQTRQVFVPGLQQMAAPPVGQSPPQQQQQYGQQPMVLPSMGTTIPSMSQPQQQQYQMMQQMPQQGQQQAPQMPTMMPNMQMPQQAPQMPTMMPNMQMPQQQGQMMQQAPQMPTMMPNMQQPQVTTTYHQ